jgi:hypothetical protein
MFKYELGSYAQDIVSGFKGNLVSATKFLTGCNRYCIEAKSKNGEKPISICVDENAIKLLKNKGIKIETKEIKGGPNERWSDKR